MRGFFYILSCALVLRLATAFRLPIFGLAEIGNRFRSHGALRAVAKGKSKSQQKSRHNRNNKREEPVTLTDDELEQLGLPAGMNLSFNASNITARGPAPPPPPPEIPRRPGPMADDPYTNATGCDPFPCELEDHYRPPLKVPPPLPLPRCGRYGEREIHLAWNGNLNHTQNLTVELSTLVNVQLGYDKTYGKPNVKKFQPSYFMDYENGMDEYHDCREVMSGYVGYFKVVCKASVSHDPYSEDEFDAEWGIGNLTIDNATYNSTLDEYYPAQCIKDTFMPNLESMEFGVPPDDTQYARYTLESRFPFLDKQRVMATTLPTWWLPQRCQTCTVPNIAYWDQIFGARPEYNISNVTNVTAIVEKMNISNLTIREQTRQALNMQFPKLPIEQKTFPEMPIYNLTLVPQKPSWSHRILMEPLPPGLPEWTQIINPWDGIILRFDECVIADHKEIVWTPLNPPPFEISTLKPRGYRNEIQTMRTRASDVYLVSVNCGNVTIRPPDILIMKNLGQLYEVEIPEGTFYDYAEIPNYSAGWKFNVTVRDLITPHVLMDWNRAFRPLAFHTGRYPWHNITIRFDEPMMLNARYKEHKMRLDPRDSGSQVIDIDFHDEEVVQWQEGGLILHINPFGHAKDDWTGDPIGFELGATYRVTIDPTVITDLFGNNFTGLSSCPVDCSVVAPLYPYEPCTCTGEYKFTIATPAQMALRKKIAFYLKYTRRRINDTLHMFHLPTTQDEMAVNGMPLNGVWTNSATQGRMINIMFFIGQADAVLADPDGLIREQGAQSLQKVYDELTAYKFEPRGYPFKDDWVCPDLETHVLPGRMKCQYIAQKSATGYNVALRAGSFYFREGCLCRVFWQGGCPFSLSQFPNYKDLGFSMYDEKFVNGALTANALTENYLCWYWSEPDYPEYGYLAHPTNYYPREVPENQWYCAYPRIPEQPCSTLRPWEWEMAPTEKGYWNKASAWRPQEIVPEAASFFQRGNVSFHAYKTIGLLRVNDSVMI